MSVFWRNLNSVHELTSMSDYVIISIKFRLIEVGNDKYIILYNFDGGSMGSFEVKVGGVRA